MKQLSQREKTLGLIVGGILFIGINLFLVSRFLHNQSELRQLASQKAADLRMMEEMCKEKESWAKKDAWLREKQPKLVNQSGAAVQLHDYIKENAQRCEVTLENPVIGSPVKGAHSITVPVSVETKSSWEALIRFLCSVQQPDQFVVFENASIQIDATDQSQMRGKFKIARWYAAQ